MLCASLWNDLRDSLINNSCRFMFESEKDFNSLRKEIRSVEQELCASAATHQFVSSSVFSASSADSKAITKELKSWHNQLTIQ